MSTIIDPRRVQLPSGRSFDLYPSRWDGVLDREQFDFCRQHGIPLAYDCLQTGWVVGTCTDDLDAATSAHATASVPSAVALTDPECRADDLSQRARAAVERGLHDARSGMISRDEAERGLRAVVERLEDEFPSAHALPLADALHFALRSQLAGALRELRGPQCRPAEPDDRGTFSFRPWTSEDVADYFDLLNSPRVWRYLPEPFPTPFTPDTARTLLEVAAIGFHHETVAVVVDDQPVGQCLLRFNQPTVGVRTAEVAYWLGEQHWGKGWMSRILTLFTDRSFRRHRVDAIYAWIMPGNQASIRTAERSGYRRDWWSLESRVAASLRRSEFVRYATYRADWR
jgi:[ribosomal protein S5]-alanine N-acetyltransferase